MSAQFVCLQIWIQSHTTNLRFIVSLIKGEPLSIERFLTSHASLPTSRPHKSIYLWASSIPWAWARSSIQCYTFVSLYTAQWWKFYVHKNPINFHVVNFTQNDVIRTQLSRMLRATNNNKRSLRCEKAALNSSDALCQYFAFAFLLHSSALHDLFRRHLTHYSTKKQELMALNSISFLTTQVSW